MKHTAALIILGIILILGYVAGFICLGLALINQFFGISSNVTLAYVGFGLLVGTSVLKVTFSSKEE